MKRLIAALGVVLLPVGSAPAQEPPETSPPPAAKSVASKRMFWGGGLGLSFGDVEYVNLSPWFGYWIHPRVAAGVGLEYVYRKDKRATPDLSTSDYGGSLFTRVTVAQGVFAAVQYEYLRYERYATTTRKTTDDYSSLFVGGGIAEPMGGSAVFVVSAMYNLSWSEADAGPYDSPYVVTVGVSVGF